MRLLERLGVRLERHDLIPLGVATLASATLLVSIRHPNLVDVDALLHGQLATWGYGDRARYLISWFVTSAVLYLGVPGVFAALTGTTNRLGLGLGDWRSGAKATVALLAVMLPITLVAANQTSFQGAYPLAGTEGFFRANPDGPSTFLLAQFVAYEATYVLYFISWEFLFRGWMVHSIAPSWGVGPAIAVQLLPFVVMHAAKPEAEGFGSILAGLALALLALRTRSMWYGVVLHSVIAVAMDIAVTLRAH